MLGSHDILLVLKCSGSFLVHTQMSHNFSATIIAPSDEKSCDLVGFQRVCQDNDLYKSMDIKISALHYKQELSPVLKYRLFFSANFDHVNIY